MSTNTTDITIEDTKYKNIVIITDIPVASKCPWIYRKTGVRVHQYNKDMMVNRHPSFFITNGTNGIDILWLDITQKKCREWVQQNYNELQNEWFIVSVYNKFDEWIYDVEPKATISFLQFNKLEHIELDKLYEIMVSSSHRVIKRPSCFSFFKCLYR